MLRSVLSRVGVGAALVLTAAACTGPQAGSAGPAANPCAGKNPCAAKQRGAPRDATAEAALQVYRGWKKVNEAPVLSQTHGNRFVFTYVNPTAARAALSGAFPFPVGAVLAKESFENDGGKAGPKGPLFVMEKRARGYDPERNDWHYAMLNPDVSWPWRATVGRRARPRSAPAATAWRGSTTSSLAMARS